MKILAICGSPRKGNTYSALNSIRDNFPELDYEIIMLKDIQFELCKGCYTCVTRGEKLCPVKDEKELLLQKINAADGVIMASPVYSHMVSATMKNFFDRFGYLAHRPAFFDKYAMSVASCSGYGAKHALDYMDKMMGIFGFNLVPPVELHYKPGRDTGKQVNDNNQLITEGLNRLITRINEGEKDKPALADLVPFGIFKGIAEVARDSMPADYAYYKDKNDYYYDTDLPFFKKWIAGKVVKKELEKILN